MTPIKNQLRYSCLGSTQESLNKQQGYRVWHKTQGYGYLVIHIKRKITEGLKTHETNS